MMMVRCRIGSGRTGAYVRSYEAYYISFRVMFTGCLASSAHHASNDDDVSNINWVELKWKTADAQNFKGFRQRFK